MKQASDQDLQLGKWLGGAALGAIVMYMLDPERGAPRRALSGEKLRQLGRQTGDAFDKVVHGIAEQAEQLSNPRESADSTQSRRSFSDAASGSRYGAESRGAHQSAHVGDYRNSEPSSYAESASAGGAGSMLQQGVAAIGNVFGNAIGNGASERESRSPLTSPASTSRRGAMGGATLAGATVLGLGGLMAPRSPVGMAMGLAGLALLVRASGRHPVRSMLGRSAPARSVEVEKTIRIDASPEHVFDAFANYENFPRFMSNVIEVRDLGERRSHWIVKGPAGTQFAWNAVLTEHSRPRRLAWESEPGAEVDQTGAILFEPIHSGTRVTVRMSYRPPAGALGHAVASLLGSDPKRQMDEDLARMKSLVEGGTMYQTGSRTGISEGKFLH